MRPRIWLFMLLGVVGCPQILGDDFVVVDEPASTATTATTSVTTTTGGGAGGNTGSCALGDWGNCGVGKKCSVVDYATGDTACITAGDHPAFTRCASDAECVEGTFCDPPGQVCLPLCTTSDDCPLGGSCIQPTDVSANPIPLLAVCLSNCDPFTGAPCDQSHGALGCIPSPTGMEFQCWQDGGLSLGDPCYGADCPIGTVCVDPDSDGAQNCMALCTMPSGTECVAPQTCTSVFLYSNGQELGVCG